VSGLGALVVLLLAGPDGTRSYDAVRRAAYVDSALDAVGRAGAEELAKGYEYASAMDRNKCTAPTVRLKVECLTTLARAFCKGKDSGCGAMMDVIDSNVLAEAHFVSTDRRYEIMRTHRDWRAEVAREIRRGQGTLAVDFRLHQTAGAGAGSLGKQIDGYCVAAADKSNLSWQSCASSLVWFIGASK
jgi:hypothetical protein